MTNHTLQKAMFQTGCLLAGTAVMLGAFGAHSLKDLLSATEMETFETGIKYQFIHALAILILSLSLRRLREQTARAVWKLFLFGSLLFSVSLYLLATRSVIGFPEQFNRIGALTPIGGVFFITGWFYLAYKGFRVPEGESHHKRKTASSKSEDEMVTE